MPLTGLMYRHPDHSLQFEIVSQVNFDKCQITCPKSACLFLQPLAPCAALPKFHLIYGRLLVAACVIQRLGGL